MYDFTQVSKDMFCINYPIHPNILSLETITSLFDSNCPSPAYLVTKSI